jgi:3-dehydroquinate synthase
MDQLRQLNVELGERSYSIWIGAGLLAKVSSFLQDLKIDSTQKILIITDEHVAPLYAQHLLKDLEDAGYSTYIYTAPAGEKSKSLTEYEKIMTYAIEQKLDRQSLVLALGGGVVGDLAGFVASTFMRGIPFIQIPTTILAHDSSVGGKVAINHPLGKNLIGSFYQPLAVIYDTQTFHSLPEREIFSGFAEVLKEALIWDVPFVEWLEVHRDQCLALQEPYLSEAIYRACQVKTFVVSKDEKEQGIRAILNFGHTFGHAFESLGRYSEYTHGEAVSIGMVIAARLSESIYGTAGVADRVSKLLSAYGLPVSLERGTWSISDIVEKMYADKKVVAGSLNLVLLKELGSAELVQNVSPELIEEVLKKGEGIT